MICIKDNENKAGSISFFKLISFAHNLRIPDLFWRKVSKNSSYVLAQQACMLDVPSS